MNEQLGFGFEELPAQGGGPVFEVPKQEQKSKYERLNDLALRCRDCKRCELHRERTQVVFSDGHRDAKIMLIGEGPGYHEDQTGRPFVGNAGQLLDKMLAAIGLTREEDVYIANIVKCRPPNNRTPHQSEMKACRGYLDKQIALIQPQIIILAGSTALKGLFFQERMSITRLRGQWLDWKGIPCMPLFHPAYLLRNDGRYKGSAKWLTWQDLKSIKAKAIELGLKNP